MALAEWRETRVRHDLAALSKCIVMFCLHKLAFMVSCVIVVIVNEMSNFTIKSHSL